MKRLAFAGIISLILPLAACNQPGPNPNPPPAPLPSPAKPGVDIQAPGVRVQSDKDGTTVRTPGADIDVNKK